MDCDHGLVQVLRERRNVSTFAAVPRRVERPGAIPLASSPAFCIRPHPSAGLMTGATSRGQERKAIPAR
jgi:hypothetical protein